MITEPDRFESRFLSKVVDVPVGAFGGAHVMPKTTTDAARPECAADVNVKSSLEQQVAESPNTNQCIGR